MSFGSELRQVLNICHIKMTSLSSHLGYDVSYISKWISGAKYPAEGGAEQICDSIARYSCSGASEKELAALRRLVGIPAASTVEETARRLADRLLSAYARDRGVPDRHVGAAASEPFGSEPAQSCAGCLSAFLRGVLDRDAEGGLELIVSARSFLELTGLLDSFAVERPGRELRLHVFYDPADFPSPADYCRFISSACMGRPAVSTDIYELCVPRREYSGLLCAVRGRAMLVRAFGAFGGDFPAIVTDAAEAGAQYDRLMSHLRGHKFDSFAYGDRQYERYLFKFHAPKSGESIRMLTSDMLFTGDELFSASGFRNDLIESGEDVDRLKWYFSLYDMEREMTIISYESAIVDFCRTGRSRMSPDSERPAVMSPETRRMVLESMIRVIESGKTPIHILSDGNPVLNRRAFNGSVSCNGGLVCVIPAGSPQVTYLKTPFAVESFCSVFDSIDALPGEYLLRGADAAGFLRYAMNFIP